MSTVRACSTKLAHICLALAVFAAPSLALASSLFEEQYVLIEGVTNCAPLAECNNSSGGMHYVELGGIFEQVSFPFDTSAFANVWLTDTHMTIGFDVAVSFFDYYPSFNGLRLVVTSATAPKITSVDLTDSSIERFSEELQYRVAFNPQAVYIDFGGIVARPGDRLEFEFNSPVPEPTSDASLTAGLGLLLWLGRRRARTKSSRAA